MNINVSDAFITYGISLVSLVFTLLVLILFIAKGKSHKYSSIIFRWLLVMTIVVALFNIFSALFKVNNHDFTYLSCRITIFFTNCWNLLLLFYILFVFRDDNKNKEFFSKHSISCFIIGIILVLVNLLACIFLKIDFTRAGEGLPYLMSGSLQMFTDIIGGIAVVFAVIYIAINRKKLDKLAILLCIYTVAFCGFTLIGQVAGFLSLNNTSFQHALVVFFLFLSLESQDALLVAEFRESTKKADEYNKLRSDFIMNMSHELRTPLTAVLGFSDSLLSNDFSLEELKEDSKNIYISSKNLLNLINSIIDVSKLDGNKEIVNMKDYSLDSVIYDISSVINSYITKENLIFTIDANENCPNDLVGDDRKINKILKILLMTAIDHTNYGEVSLNVYSNAIDSANHEVVFHIKNSGHTLTVSDFERNLDDLIKVSSDNDNVIDSGNLNLIVAKSLIDLIGGSIEFINESGKGTQFIVKIKQKVTSQNKLGNIREKIQTKYVLSHQILSLGDKKVLIVDTQKLNIDIIERLLKQYSFNIDTSLSLNDGVALFNAYNYDLIFVNDNLGDATGLDFINKLNSTGNRVPPVVGIINKSDNYSNEYYDVLEIPLEFRSLNNVINKVFAKEGDVNEL